MATDLDVPLWVVKENERQFWSYIETPRGKRQDYKTSYRTIKRWVQMKLDKKLYENCNEVEKLELASNHPDKVAQVKAAFEWWEQEEKRKEQERKNGSH
jgi:hypothetical protein